MTSTSRWRFQARSDLIDTTSSSAITRSERSEERYSSTASRRNSGGYGTRPRLLVWHRWTSFLRGQTTQPSGVRETGALHTGPNRGVLRRQRLRLLVELPGVCGSLVIQGPLRRDACAGARRMQPFRGPRAAGRVRTLRETTARLGAASLGRRGLGPIHAVLAALSGRAPATATRSARGAAPRAPGR
jgi:hypothetical protein